VTRLLLDTHTFLWALTNDRRLGAAARQAMLDPAAEVYVSIACFWEIALKVRIGKLATGGYTIPQLIQTAQQDGFRRLAIEPRHLAALSALPHVPDHKDPFDHLLIAQAIVDRFIFVSEDEFCPRYPVQHMWCSDRPSPPAAP
jgi:PIN domain nuclease of toxin-antitoxin system